MLVKGITAYYNEIDPFCCAWLSNLMDAGQITPGKIDNRSILDVRPEDFAGYTRQHFFAGIAGWDLALNLAGWGDTPAMSGSCPCQPFSHAGSEKGFEDERHLWPVFFDLIKECRPAIVIGEQVSSAIGKGWLDLVFSDLEGEGFACGAAVLGAHSAGSPHKRQRLYWAGTLGDAASIRRDEQRDTTGAEVQGRPSIRESSQLEPQSEQDRQLSGRLERLGGSGSLADAYSQQSEPDERRGSGERADTQVSTGRHPEQLLGSGRTSGSLGDASGEGLQGHGEAGREQVQEEWQGEERHSSSASFWDDAEWIECRDGVSRPIERISIEMADGFPGGLGLVRDGGRCFISPLIEETKNTVQRLKGYGNAIVPQVAAVFVRSLL